VRGVGPGPDRRRAFAARRRALHRFSLLLARHASLVAFARRLAAGRPSRLARIALFLDFVHRLAAAEARRGGTGVARLREDDLAVAVLTAMLRASGERATVEYMRETAFVRVAVTRADLVRLPPWARLLRSRAGTVDLALAPSARWRPAGYLGPDVRAALDRRSPVALAS
jgi:hypothetical protein